MDAREIAFEIWMRWMPSIHSIFENPRNKLPLSRISPIMLHESILFGMSPSIQERNRKNNPATALRANMSVAADIYFRTFFVKRFPNGGIIIAKNTNISPGFGVSDPGKMTKNAPMTISAPPTMVVVDSFSIPVTAPRKNMVKNTSIREIMPTLPGVVYCNEKNNSP